MRTVIYQYIFDHYLLISMRIMRPRYCIIRYVIGLHGGSTTICYVMRLHGVALKQIHTHINCQLLETMLCCEKYAVSPMTVSANCNVRNITEYISVIHASLTSFFTYRSHSELTCTQVSYPPEPCINNNGNMPK